MMESLRSSIEGSQPPSKRQKRKTVACANPWAHQTRDKRLTTDIDVAAVTTKRQNVMARSLARTVFNQTRLVNTLCEIVK